MRERKCNSHLAPEDTPDAPVVPPWMGKVNDVRAGLDPERAGVEQILRADKGVSAA